MDLLPDDASFHERVQTLFSRFRGHGLSLSATDLELVDAWAADGVPFEVVARGIQVAAEQALWDAPDGRGTLRSLAACRRAVNAEFAKYSKRAAGKGGRPTDEPFHLVRHRKLELALQRLVDDYPVLQRHTLRAPADATEAVRHEHLVLAWLMRALPFNTRLAVLRAARTASDSSSRQTRVEVRRFHRDALLRRQLDLKPFW